MNTKHTKLQYKPTSDLTEEGAHGMGELCWSGAGGGDESRGVGKYG